MKHTKFGEFLSFQNISFTSVKQSASGKSFVYCTSNASVTYLLTSELFYSILEV